MNQATALINVLAAKGVERAFLVTGGGAMFLNEALQSSSIECIATHHEQAASMAAEAYFRVSGKVAILCSTSGPGALNCLNGVFGAYTDSIPMIVISGQAKTTTLRISDDEKLLRQIGDQEADIPNIVRPIVKAVYQIGVDCDIHHVIDEAYFMATSGRPGPVWIDFPIDVQSKHYVDKNDSSLRTKTEDVEQNYSEIFMKIYSAKRPTFLVGTGMSSDIGRQLIERATSKTSIPFQPAWTAIDLIPVTNANFAGRPSTVGDRAGGLIQEAADLVIALGSSLSLRQVGFNTKTILGNKVIQVDRDSNYHFRSDIEGLEIVTTDPVQFLSDFIEYYLMLNTPQSHLKWHARCKEIVSQFSNEPAWTEKTLDGINPYSVMMNLPEMVPPNSVFVCGDASASVMFFQAAPLLPNQRTFTNAGAASMGYELPAAIGAAVGTDRPIICIAGDGSFQQNMQELSLLKFHNLNIQIIYLDNFGYLSIRTSQLKHFKNKYWSDPDSGLPFPNMQNIAEANGLEYIKVTSLEDLKLALGRKMYNFLHIAISPTMVFQPKTGTKLDSEGVMQSSTIADLEPFLPKRTLERALEFLTSDY
jgi:acetolactate synthase-1/2/3 large subunit